MERRLRSDGDGDDDGDGDVEQFREFVVDGELYAALDLSRRLLQTHAQSFSRRNDAALLLLDRLRSNREDTADHANALLRVLANYATPTKELTEELLALLFFCEHRVQIIHHLSKLTYQSKECVQLVLSAYIDLLSSDRSLLVPILGSLADLPLQPSDKARVVDATESMLDAASEDDVPAVVQSLLSMLVPANAPRIVRKIRNQCNRLTTHHTTTLSLTMDVVLRHAVAGSSALVSFLRVIRHSETLTIFDVVFLALLLARPSENGATLGVVAALTSKGKWTRVVIYETMQRLHSHKWQDAFPCTVRLASAMIATCMKAATRLAAPAISSTIQCAVDILGYLLLLRTNAQEEALSLLLSMASQPQRLLLSTSQTTQVAAVQPLCWDVARCVANQLAHIAVAHAHALVPYAHIFLDHLYAVASSSSQVFDSSETTYPTSILESLCRTMVTLAKHEPGMVSLLMITIQKQLVVPATTSRSHAAIVLHVKQLMAVFLAGEMLRQSVGDKGDRVSLLNWVRKLLSSAAVSDETTVHVVHLLSSNEIQKTLSSADLIASSALITSVCRRHGLVLKGYADVITKYGGEADVLPGLIGQKTGWLEASAVFDVSEFVRVGQLGRPPMGWHTIHLKDKSQRVAETYARSKIALLKAEVGAYLSSPTVSSADRDSKDRALVCSFALPTVSEDSTTLQSLPTTLWSYVCALQYGILSTNELVRRQNTNMRAPTDVARQRKRLLQRVQSCWVLHQRLRSLLDESKRRFKQRNDDESDSTSLWLRFQVSIVDREASAASTSRWLADPGDSLCSLGGRLSLHVVSAMFEGLWKQQSSTIESGLEIELFRAFPARLQASSIIHRDASHTRNLLERRNAVVPAFASLQGLASVQDGKRTLKYLSRRLFDYAEQLVTMEGATSAEDDEDSARLWVQEGVLVLCDALRSIIDTCRQQQQHRHNSVGEGRHENNVWEDTVLALLAKGTIDERLRRPEAMRSSMWAASCEIMFKSLVNAATRAKDSDVACSLMDVLRCLVVHTQRQEHISQLSLALLHVPYPSTQSANTTTKRPLKLPLADPAEVVSLSRLLRPMPPKVEHLVYLTVGVWTSAPTLQDSLTHAFYMTECMEALVRSAADKAAKRVGGRAGKRKGEQQRKEADSQPQSDDDAPSWIVRDGEHGVLKNLTNDTFPFLLEVVLACEADSPLRAAQSITADKRSESSNPYLTVVGTLVALSKCIDVFVSAELSGFNMPIRLSASILRMGPIILKNAAEAVTAGLDWREKSRPQIDKTTIGASLEDVQALMEAAHGLIISMERAAKSFQDKVMLKMQLSASADGPATDDQQEDVRTSKAKARSGASGGRWGNELLQKAHGKQFQRRKALSKSEAKLLPYFTHAIEQLKVLVMEQCGIFRIEVEDGRVTQTIVNTANAFRMDDDALDKVLGILETEDSDIGSKSLPSDEALVKLWTLMKHDDGTNDDEGEDDVSGEESDEERSNESVDADDEGTHESEDIEEENEDEEDAYAVVNVPPARKKRQTQSEQVLVPQKKRIKPTQM